MDSLIQPMMDWLQSNPAFSQIYSIIIFFVLCGLTIKFIVLPLYHHVYQPVKNFFNRIAGGLDKVEFLEKEFHPNGGSTLKDAVSRIETQVQHINVFAAKATSKQEAIFQFLGMGNDGFAFFESDKNGECTYASPKFCDMCGLSEEEALGMGWISAIHSEDRDDVYNEWKTCVNQHRAFVLSYKHFNRRNSVTINVSCHAIPIKIDGVIVSYLGTLRQDK